MSGHIFEFSAPGTVRNPKTRVDSVSTMQPVARYSALCRSDIASLTLTAIA